VSPHINHLRVNIPTYGFRQAALSVGVPRIRVWVLRDPRPLILYNFDYYGADGLRILIIMARMASEHADTGRGAAPSWRSCAREGVGDDDSGGARDETCFSA
jgi:hypothetical protein